MCGIAGYFYFSEKKTTCEAILKMSAEIVHRGPDDEGFVFIDVPGNTFLEMASPDSDKTIQEKLKIIDDSTFNFSHNIAMAHRRFSIIDLSPAGHQPMWNQNKSLCVVTNGEILNYIELREELKSQGMVFGTNSDTEVVLAAYSFWGTEAFKRFTGFWAIALYDSQKNILVLSRDRIGKKPLYIYHDENKLIWASEIKSLLQVIQPSALHLNEKSLWYYLYYGNRDIGHATSWKEINMMDKSAYMVISLDGCREPDTYWQIPFTRKKVKDISFKSAAKKLTELLSLSLNERLRADVPIAFELSGGMDSSTLVALRAGLDKSEFSAFTVKYSDKKIDEHGYASTVAERYPNVNHHLINFKKINIWDHMQRFIYLMEEPFHSPNVVVNHLLRKQMRSHGYKVIIVGAGGDEVLAGYKEYAVPIMKYLLAHRHYLGFIKNLLLYKERYPLRIKPMARIIANRIFKFVPETFPYDSYITISDEEKTRLVYPKEINALLLANMKDLKMHYWMSVGEKAAMGIPLETRSPFLDHRVVEFLFSLPIPYFMNNGWLKWLLRKSVQHLLPRSVLWRKEKMGYPFPLARWLIESQDIIKGVLTEFNNDGWLDNRSIVRDFSSLVEKHPDFLWRAVSFQLWYTRLMCNEIIDFKKYQK
jgi:asparagine synthase (glutamine-hydrolysing)